MLPRQPSAEAEAEPLIGEFRRTALQEILETLGYIASKVLDGYDRLVDSINALAILEALLLPFLAFPGIDALVNRVLSPFGLPIIFSKLGLDIAADRKKEFTLNGHQFKFENLKPKVSALVDSSNTYYFALTAAIALFIAGKAALYDIGEEQVNVSNWVYLTFFVAPSILVAAIHGILNLNKDKWLDSNTTSGIVMRRVHHGVMALYNSSNLNSFLMLILGSAWGVSEGNHVNPYDRLGLFGVAFMAGLTLAIISANLKSSNKHIERFINTTCAATYVAGTTGPNARQINGDLVANLFITAFSVAAFTSIMSVAFCPAKPRNQLDVENQISDFVVVENSPVDQPEAPKELHSPANDTRQEQSAASISPAERVSSLSMFRVPTPPPAQEAAEAKQALLPTGTETTAPVTVTTAIITKPPL